MQDGYTKEQKVKVCDLIVKAYLCFGNGDLKLLEIIDVYLHLP